ncbi:MAG: hypothetical protein IJX94_02510 [Clostridia bacterium]|nr:hypothetical protein [Clostridia bacterium]
MLKGIQKRVIWMRITGNRYFEGAYFILHSDAPNHPAPCGENEMIREANRILAESHALRKRGGARPRRSSASRAVPFFCGAVCGALSVLLSWILVLLFA